MGTETLNFERMTVNSPERLNAIDAAILPFKGGLKRLGMVPVEYEGVFQGYNFSVAVDASVVHAVDVCTHDQADPFKIVKRWRINEQCEVEPQLSPEDTTHTLGGFIPAHDPETGVSIGVGTRYSLRVVDSDWTRNDGTRTEDIPLIDSHARRVELLGKNEFSPTMNGVSEYPLSVIISDKPYEWKYPKPQINRTDMNICEMHVVSATPGMPMAPEREHLQGTYAGLATPEVIAHLDKQHYNAVSLLPVQLPLSEAHLHKEGKRNFWNYSTGSYFALNLDYAARPENAENEFRGMVDTLHGAGKKVFIDVVYNHTAEGGVDDPTYSYEALNRRNMYVIDRNGNLVEDTGCGNMLDMTKPAVIREIVESLRYYVTEMGVDGFRFDLAGILTDGHWDIDQAPLMKAIAEDDVLSKVDLIAEPWGAGKKGFDHYRLYQYRHAESAQWMAWSDQTRNAIQAAIGATEQTGEPFIDNREMSNKLSGYDMPDRTVNYVSSHDGKTLHDMAPNAAAEDLAAALVLLSQGVPMRQMGSEFGYSQNGDHNGYSRDANERAPYLMPWDKLSDPDSLEAQQYEFQAKLAELRAHSPVFRQAQVMIGKTIEYWGVDEDGNPKLKQHPLGEQDLSWLGAFGLELTPHEWDLPDQYFAMELSGYDWDDHNYTILVNGNKHPVKAKLGRKEHPSTYGTHEVVINTSNRFAAIEVGEGVRITEESVVVAPGSLIVIRQLAQRLPGAGENPPKIESFSLL